MIEGDFPVMTIKETAKYLSFAAGLKTGKSTFYLSACNAQADKMAREGLSARADRSAKQDLQI